MLNLTRTRRWQVAVGYRSWSPISTTSLEDGPRDRVDRAGDALLSDAVAATAAIMNWYSRRAAIRER
jgi:hypothetical protein